MPRDEERMTEQERNVRWSVDPRGALTLTVDLYGEAAESKSGKFGIVGRTRGYEAVDDRQWAGMSLSFVVGHRRPGLEREWLDRKHAEALREWDRREKKRLKSERKASRPKRPRKPRSDKGKRRGPNRRTKAKEECNDQADEGNGRRDDPEGADDTGASEGDS